MNALDLVRKTEQMLVDGGIQKYDHGKRGYTVIGDFPKQTPSVLMSTPKFGVAAIPTGCDSVGEKLDEVERYLKILNENGVPAEPVIRKDEDDAIIFAWIPTSEQE
ncbi:MAG: hypothetical protein WAX85_03145 [Minisyncoccia bacterium]